MPRARPREHLSSYGRYEGERNGAGEPEGKGEYSGRDGGEYLGEWRRGQLHGKGTYRRALRSAPAAPLALPPRPAAPLPPCRESPPLHTTTSTAATAAAPLPPRATPSAEQMGPRRRRVPHPAPSSTPPPRIHPSQHPPAARLGRLGRGVLPSTSNRMAGTRALPPSSAATFTGGAKRSDPRRPSARRTRASSSRASATVPAAPQSSPSHRDRRAHSTAPFQRGRPRRLPLLRRLGLRRAVALGQERGARLLHERGWARLRRRVRQQRDGGARHLHLRRRRRVPG